MSWFDTRVPQSLCSTKVGSLPALVSHEEIQMWAAGADIEGKDRNLRELDDWELAEKRELEAARQAKIVAVSLNENSVFMQAAFLVARCHRVRLAESDSLIASIYAKMVI